jgi:hypothetical protein
VVVDAPLDAELPLMAKKLTARDRCHQIHRWLKIEYPTKKGTRLRVVKRMPKELGHKCDGVIVFDVSPPLIWVNGNGSRSSMIYTVLHEYAHALLADRHPRDWKAIEHSDPFYRILGMLERRFFSGGDKESQEV